MRVTSVIAPVFLAMLIGVAHAEPPEVPPGQANQQQQGQQQGQAQGQLQGQAQGQLQGQAQKSVNKNFNANLNANKNFNAAGAIAGAKNQGNNTNVHVEGDDNDPPAYAPNVSLTSANCIGSVSGSGGGGGIVSIGLGSTIAYEDCFKMEAAKIYISMGRKDLADQVLQSIDFVNAATKSAAAASVDDKVAYFYKDKETGLYVRVNFDKTQKLPQGDLTPVNAAEAPAKLKKSLTTKALPNKTKTSTVIIPEVLASAE